MAWLALSLSSSFLPVSHRCCPLSIVVSRISDRSTSAKTIKSDPHSSKLAQHPRINKVIQGADEDAPFLEDAAAIDDDPLITAAAIEPGHLHFVTLHQDLRAAWSWGGFISAVLAQMASRGRPPHTQPL